LKDKAGEAYETGSKIFSIILFFRIKFFALLGKLAGEYADVGK
jgi:hypothetical protein